MKKQIEEILLSSLTDLGLAEEGCEVFIPQNTDFGDYTTNIAMVMAQKLKKDPRDLAEKIASKLMERAEIEKAEVAGPGFINIHIKNRIFINALKDILDQKDKYGSNDSGLGKRIQVEFISANPTGPLHIGNARGGPIGQTIANLFKLLNYTVETEFYINDIGGQVERFAETLYYWYAKKTDDRVVFPDGGYKGDYMKDISEAIQKEKKAEIEILKDRSEFLAFFKKEGLYHTIKKIREDASLLGIKFDNWVNQSDFEFNGKTENVIEKLVEKGSTVKKEGALWFKNEDDPDLLDQESVLKKSDDEKTITYFADDIAYHVDKFDRGFDRVIDVWGANHSGHVPRLKSALSVLGFHTDKLDIILYQYVRLKEDDHVVSMGKRFGNFITIPQILDSGVKADAFKFFILAQNPNTPFDFDLKKASDVSEKNPVFYIKYAHARICSILSKADLKGENIGDLGVLVEEKEKNLIKELVRFPDLLESISQDFQVQQLPHYLFKVAQLFHDFYTNCPVINSEEKIKKARLNLIIATKYVLFNGLSICGIEAPEKM